MRQMFKALAVSAVVAIAVSPNGAIAGSSIGGQPGNGGGTTFGAPSTLLTSVLGGQAVAEAIASGDPAQIDAAILAGIALNFPGGIGSVDLEPLPGQTGAQTVAFLTSLIQNFAAAVGLPLTSASIQALLRIARTAIA